MQRHRGTERLSFGVTTLKAMRKKRAIQPETHKVSKSENRPERGCEALKGE